MIFINSSPGNSLKIFQPFLPVFMPVGVGYLMAVLKQNNIQSICIDEQVEKNILDKIKSQIHLFQKPYIFGFSVLTAAFSNALKLSLELKNNYPDSIIVFGGIHPTAMPEEVLSYNHIDIVVRGEAENVITKLVNCLKQRKDISLIESLSYRKEGKIIHHTRSAGTMNLDDLPAFPYDLFHNNKYDPGFIMSSRGCLHNCFFCSNKINSQRKFRYRNPDLVIEELSLLYHKYKRKYVYFIDDNLLSDKQRILILAKKIRESDFYGKMIFNFQTRGDNGDHDVLSELYDAGFKGVYFGIETASETLMKTLNKGETVDQVIKAITNAKKIGYHVSGNYIFGLPSETHEDRMNAIKLTKNLNLDLVKYNNATPYPGTELYNLAKQQNRLNIKGVYENINSVSTFIENPFKKIPFSYIPKGSSEKDIRYDILHGYFSFYFKWKRLKGVFIHPDLNNAWFDFGHGLGDFLKKIPAIIILWFFLCIKFGQFVFQFIFNHKNNMIKS